MTRNRSIATAVIYAVLLALYAAWRLEALTEINRGVELLLAGEEIKTAIVVFYESGPARQKSFPRRLDDLVASDRPAQGGSDQGRGTLAAIPQDPMTGRADWIPMASADGGIMGVRSRSHAPARLPSDFGAGAGHYQRVASVSEWLFAYTDPPLDIGGKALTVLVRATPQLDPPEPPAARAVKRNAPVPRTTEVTPAALTSLPTLPRPRAVPMQDPAPNITAADAPAASGETAPLERAPEPPPANVPIIAYSSDPIERQCQKRLWRVNEAKCDQLDQSDGGRATDECRRNYQDRLQDCIRGS